MSIKYFNIAFLTLVIFSTLFCANLQAQGIRIIDCRGNTRALRQQADLTAVNNQVSISVVDAKGQGSDGSKFNLTNGQGVVLTAVAKDGIVEFFDVGPGVWMLGSEDPSLFFTSISLSDTPVAGFWDSSGSFLSQAGKIVLIAGAVVGAGVLINETTDGGGGGGSDNPVNPPGMGCPSCNPDAPAPSLPPFE